MATAVSTFLLCIATAALIGVGYLQLRQLIQTNGADFADRMKRDFFTTEARRLIFLVEHNFLDFYHPASEIPWFGIVQQPDGPIRNRMRELHADGGKIGTFDVDDVLLGPLEDVAFFEKTGKLDLETVYSFFGSHIEDVMTNKALLDYIAWARRDANASDIYINLEYLHKKLKKYDEVLTSNKPRLG